MAIGTRIDRILADKRWSQARLAREAGLPQSTINSIVRKDPRMTPHLALIASTLGVSPTVLTTDISDAEPLLPELNYDQRQLLACFEAMDESDRQMLLAMAMRLAERTNLGRVHARLQSYAAEESQP